MIEHRYEIKLSFLTKAYAAVGVVFSAWVLIASVGMMLVVSVVMSKQDGMSIRWTEAITAVAFGLLFVAQLLFFGYFFAASIGVLRKSVRWAKPFRRCVWVVLVYCVVCAAISPVLIPFQPEDMRPLGVAITAVMVGFAFVVATVSKRVFKDIDALDRAQADGNYA